MKDIGYYAGFLSSEALEEISNAPIGALIDLMQGTAEAIYASALSDTDYEYEVLNRFGVASLSDRDKLALIRGLCDRIELKLMEGAK
jgi:hypothetical protein